MQYDKLFLEYDKVTQVPPARSDSKLKFEKEGGRRPYRWVNRYFFFNFIFGLIFQIPLISIELILLIPHPSFRKLLLEVKYCFRQNTKRQPIKAAEEDKEKKGKPKLKSRRAKNRVNKGLLPLLKYYLNILKLKKK